MSKRTLLCLCSVILLSQTAEAAEYRSVSFVIQSELDSRFIDIVKTNAEAFHNNMVTDYSLDRPRGSLTIYCSKTESETNKLLAGHGYSDEVSTSYYISNSPGVYVYQLDDEGEFAGWDSLFYGIARHFISFNFRMPPEWFSDGLSSFLAKHAEIVNGKLVISGPRPGNNFALSEKIKNSRLNIEMLYGLSTEQFYLRAYWPDFASQLFSWLHETKKLAPYLKRVRQYGYDVRVLLNTTLKDSGKINMELSDFMSKSCSAEAAFSEALATDELVTKREKFLEALKLKPDYHKARLGLVKCLYKSKDYQKCEENLQQIVNARQSAEYVQAAALMGNLIYYSQKDYTRALEYYNKAWNYSTNYVYRYRIAYRIGNCYNHLKNSNAAVRWYQMFLSSKWNPNDMKLCADYAEKYTNYKVPTSSRSLEKEKIPKTAALNTR